MTNTFADGTHRLSRAAATSSSAASASAASPSTSLMPASGRGQDRPRRAARGRLRHRLRGADRVGAVLNTAQVEAGATVLVMGLGGIGLVDRPGRARSPAPRASSPPTRWPRGARRRTRFGATDVLDPDARRRRRRRHRADRHRRRLRLRRRRPREPDPDRRLGDAATAARPSASARRRSRTPIMIAPGGAVHVWPRRS